MSFVRVSIPCYSTGPDRSSLYALASHLSSTMFASALLALSAALALTVGTAASPLPSAASAASAAASGLPLGNPLTIITGLLPSNGLAGIAGEGQTLSPAPAAPTASGLAGLLPPGLLSELPALPTGLLSLPELDAATATAA